MAPPSITIPGLNTGVLNVLPISVGMISSMIVRRIFITPGIITPVNDNFFKIGFWIHKKCRSMIPAPGIISRMKIKFNFAQVNVKIFQMHDSKLLHHFADNIDPNDFSFGQFFYKLGILRKNGINFARPGGFLMRPAQPCGDMEIKFSRKIIAELFGSKVRKPGRRRVGSEDDESGRPE